MERILSDEEKLRRAIEISQRRNSSNYRATSTTQAYVKEKKDYKLFKKMILQIIICLLIYVIFHLISTTNYVFSADVIKNTNAILNYDINFSEMYNNLMLFINQNTDTNQSIEENNTIQSNEQIIQNNVAENTVIIDNNNLIETENIVKDNESKENKQTIE